MKEHPIFRKYTRKWLHEVTGYSEAHLSRVARGKVHLTRNFIDLVCLRLNQPEGELFLHGGNNLTQCLGPAGCSPTPIGQWLEQKCILEHLSMRQLAAKAGVSHATISEAIKGRKPTQETIIKLARAFAKGPNETIALENELLGLAGYRTPQPNEQLDQPVAALIDAVRGFDEGQLDLMRRFADFLAQVKATKKDGRGNL